MIISNTSRLTFIFGWLILLYACNSEQKPDWEKIQLNVGSRTSLMKEAGIDITADSLNHVLWMKIKIRNSEKIKTVQDSPGKDTLSFTKFFVEFYSENKLVKVNTAAGEMFSSPKSFWKMADSSGNFILCSDTINVMSIPGFSLELPYYLFSTLPAGSRIPLSVRIYQKEFYSEGKSKRIALNKINSSDLKKSKENPEDSVTLYYRDSKQIQLLDVKADMFIDLPKVFEHAIKIESIVLQNDSAWNPGGSDVTLFRSSYPDLYYEAYSPLYYIQHISAIKKSTDVWDLQDTLFVYAYTEQDSVNFYLYDFDQFSKDDLIETCTVSVSSLKNTFAFSSGHIKSLKGSHLSSRPVN